MGGLCCSPAVIVTGVGTKPQIGSRRSRSTSARPTPLPSGPRRSRPAYGAQSRSTRTCAAIRKQAQGVLWLNAHQVQALCASKLEEGLSPTTVHHLHAVLHCALNQAMRWGLISRNVCDLVDAPRMASHNMQVHTPPQVKTLLRLRAMIGGKSFTHWL